MSRDPTPHLLFPSCADCNRIGLPLMPAMLRDMERDIGAEPVRAFLLAYGGREFATRAARSAAKNDETRAEAWMHTHFPGERVTIPKGPSATSARLAWTIYNRLAEGWSHTRIAAATGCHTRTVSSRHNLFRSLGILPVAPTSPSLHQETKPC